MSVKDQMDQLFFAISDTHVFMHFIHLANEIADSSVKEDVDRDNPFDDILFVFFFFFC